MYNVNPIELIKKIKEGQNPQQLIIGILEGEVQNNPMAANLYELAKQNKTNEIEKIARNITKERGLDFDTEFNSFKRQFGL